MTLILSTTARPSPSPSLSPSLSPCQKKVKSRIMTTPHKSVENSASAVMTRPKCQYPGCWHKSSKYGCCKAHVDEGLAMEVLLELKNTLKK